MREPYTVTMTRDGLETVVARNVPFEGEAIDCARRHACKPGVYWARVYDNHQRKVWDSETDE